MAAFRYPQFCPIARAAEILGHRWVLPILREFFIGPQRFSDIQRRMGRISTSVLSNRLDALERQGVLTRRDLAAPAASVVYELTDRGRALEPAFFELLRWGAQMLRSPLPGERLEPDWLFLATRAFARKDATSPLSFMLCIRGEGPDAEIRGRGGRDGTRMGIASDEPVDLRVRAPARVLLGYLSGGISPEAFSNHPDVVLEGETARIAELPTLFDIPADPSDLDLAPEHRTQQGATP